MPTNCYTFLYTNFCAADNSILRDRLANPDRLRQLFLLEDLRDVFSSYKIPYPVILLQAAHQRKAFRKKGK